MLLPVCKHGLARKECQPCMKRQMAHRIGVKPLAVPEITEETASAAESATTAPAADSTQVGTERKPAGKGWRKAKSMLTLVHRGSAPSHMPSSDTALAQHRSQSFRGLPRDQRGEATLHQHSQSLRDISREVRYRRPSSASTTSSTSTATTISSSAPAAYDWSSEQNPRHQGSSKDVLDQMRLEVEQLKRRDAWAARHHERLSLPEMYENPDAEQDARVQDLGTRPRDPARLQSARPVSLKEQLKKGQAHLEWQPANYLPPLDSEANRRKETRKVFRARNSRR